MTVTTAGGTSAPQGFTINLPPPTLTSVAPNQGTRGTTVAVTLTGTNFVAGATVVNVSGADVTATNVVVVSPTSLTASVVLDPAAAVGARTVTVTTAGGTSGAQTFTINLPPPGSATFAFTGGEQLFTVPAGVVAITIDATGAAGGKGSGAEELGRRAWPGRSDDGDRVRRAWHVAHGACRWQRSRWPKPFDGRWLQRRRRERRKRRRRRWCLECS